MKSRTIALRQIDVVYLIFILLWLTHSALALPNSTTTTLALSSGAGNSNSTVAAYTVVTLTATVQSAGTSITRGLVKFCDASAPLCSDSHYLGTSSLTSSGKASVKFVPASGVHSYKAVFLGTTEASASTSLAVTITVTEGMIPTATSISFNGNPSAYTLSATLSSSGPPKAPTGTVSFIDTDHGNTVLGTAKIGTSSGTFSFRKVTASKPAPVDTSIPYYTFATGIQAYADFNEDGLLDLFSTNHNGDGATVLLGKGDGTFLRGWDTKSGLGYGPLALTTADFDNDGHSDVAIGYGSGHIIRQLLGSGDGNLTVGQSQSGPQVVIAGLASDDLDGDGDFDYVVIHYTEELPQSTYAYVYFLGSNKKTLDLKIVASSVNRLILGDFNNDGLTDIAFDIGRIAIYLNNGDQSFRRLADIPVPGAYHPLATGDFNYDGKLDLALANKNNNSVSVLLGNGDGTFDLLPAIPVPQNPLAITTGDFNGDGKLDVAVASQVYLQDGIITTLLGNGDGTFAPGPQVSMGYQTSTSPSLVPALIDISAQQLNGDELTDLIVTDQGTGTITTLLGQFTYSPSMTITASPVKAGTHQIAAVYSGDSQFLTSTSDSVTLTGSAPSVSLTPHDTGLNVKPGAAVSTAIQVASLQGFSGMAHLSCQITPDSTTSVSVMPTCSVSSQDGPVTPTSALSSILTVSTTAPTSSSLKKHGTWTHSKEIFLAMVFLGLLPVRRSKRLLMLLMTLITGATLSLAGCSGKAISSADNNNNTTTTTQPTSNPGTAVGNYTVTVTATGPADPVSTTIAIWVR